MNWFERLTGFRELSYQETKARLQIRDGRLTSDATDRSYGVGSLELVSLAELRKRTENVDLPGRLSLNVLEGDIRQLHADPHFAGAVFQVASQFNLLEMVAPNVTPEDGLTGYEYDHTQGPACAIAAGAGTIYRNYFVPVGGQSGQTSERQLDGLVELGDELSRQMGVPPGTLWSMKNGYALPDRAHLDRIGTHLRDLSETDRDALRGLLRVGLHWDVEVTESAAAPQTLVTQVYCSAMPVDYSGIPQHAWADFATLILEAAYEATLLVGLLNATRGRSRRILLTRIGGGVFGNADGWINAAILRALRSVPEHGLDVQMVSRGKSGAAIQFVYDEFRKAGA
jgi:hypothetical protein